MLDNDLGCSGYGFLASPRYKVARRNVYALKLSQQIGFNVNHIEHFRQVTHRFTRAVECNDGDGLASLFTPDGVYADGFYGEFSGRSAISNMLSNHFWGHAQDFSWEMKNHVSDGQHGYVSYLFSYVSTLAEATGKRVVFDGFAQFTFAGELIARYAEQFNTGMALAQLDFDPIRIKKHLLKKADLLRQAGT